jgi:hypothetical protein
MTCEGGWIGVRSGDQCFVLSGKFEALAMATADDGAVVAGAEARLGVVLAPNIAVAIEGEGFALSVLYGHIGAGSPPLNLTGALIQFGSDPAVRVGWMHSLASQADELDAQTEVVGYLPTTTGLSIPAGGLAVQAEATIAPGLWAGVGFENLDNHTTCDCFSTGPLTPMHGTLVGVVNYDGGNLYGAGTVTAGGLLNGSVTSWAAYSHVGVRVENMDVALFTAAMDGRIESYGVTGKVDVDGLFITATVYAREWQQVYAGSVGYETDAFSIELGAHLEDDTYSDPQFREVRLRGATDVGEAVRLAGAIGVNLSDWEPPSPYIEAGLDWNIDLHSTVGLEVLGRAEGWMLSANMEMRSY